jgi:hypothetical protein
MPRGGSRYLPPRHRIPSKGASVQRTTSHHESYFVVSRLNKRANPAPAETSSMLKSCNGDCPPIHQCLQAMLVAKGG